MIGEELSSSAQSARTAATPLGYVDHSPFGGVDAHLVYARRDDGSDVHISEVESRTGAVWACPACDQPVVARKGEILAHHFSHKGRGSGCGLGAETNAHLWAKRILARELRIRIPAVNAQVGDRSDPIHGSQIYEFDEVYVERHDGNLVPDIVLVSKGRKMWVEIHVTHPCGPKKIAEIRERGISVVEVDLSDFRTSKDEAAIAHALLHTASRKWLFNRKQKAGEARLRAQIAAEEAAKAAQAQRNARSVIDAIGRIRIGAPVATVRDDHERIVALGLEEWIGRPSRGKSGFVVAPSHWQAALLARVVLPLAEGHDPYDTFDEFEALRGVAACLAPAFRKPIDRDVLRAAYGLGGGILCPLEAIRDYFDALVSAHVLEFETAETWRLSKEARTYLRRRLYRERIITGRLSSLRQRLALRTAADQTRWNFDFTAWAKQPVLNGQSPEALAASGNETWTAFERALDRIERMIGGGRPVDELLGLPLEEVAAAAREEARRTQERIERERAEREAVLADARRSSLENEALRLLDRDAEAWLGQIDDNGRTPLDLAARSPADLTQITQVLHRRWREREEAARQAELAASSLEKLFRAARKVFDERLAWLFIDSGQPRLGNRSPRSVCRDETGLKACLALLPRKRQRDTL